MLTLSNSAPRHFGHVAGFSGADLCDPSPYGYYARWQIGVGAGAYRTVLAVRSLTAYLFHTYWNGAIGVSKVSTQHQTHAARTAEGVLSPSHGNWKFA